MAPAGATKRPTAAPEAGAALEILEAYSAMPCGSSGQDVQQSLSAMETEQPVEIDPNRPGGAGSPHGLILFDGVCVLCSRGCRFVDKRDARGYFRYVPIQHEEGRTIAAQLGIDPDHPNSFAFVHDGLASTKSEAVLRIARELPWWRWVSVFMLVPRFIRDFVYDIIARHRYRWFGRTDACALPTADRRWGG